jgi:hypothetical protein
MTTISNICCIEISSCRNNQPDFSVCIANIFVMNCVQRVFELAGLLRPSGAKTDDTDACRAEALEVSRTQLTELISQLKTEMPLALNDALPALEVAARACILVGSDQMKDADAWSRLVGQLGLRWDTLADGLFCDRLVLAALQLPPCAGISAVCGVVAAVGDLLASRFEAILPGGLLQHTLLWLATVPPPLGRASTCAGNSVCTRGPWCAGWVAALRNLVTNNLRACMCDRHSRLLARSLSAVAVDDIHFAKTIAECTFPAACHAPRSSQEGQCGFVRRFGWEAMRAASGVRATSARGVAWRPSLSDMAQFGCQASLLGDSFIALCWLRVRAPLCILYPHNAVVHWFASSVLDAFDPSKSDSTMQQRESHCALVWPLVQLARVLHVAWSFPSTFLVPKRVHGSFGACSSQGRETSSKVWLAAVCDVLELTPACAFTRACQQDAWHGPMRACLHSLSGLYILGTSAKHQTESEVKVVADSLEHRSVIVLQRLLLACVEGCDANREIDMMRTLNRVCHECGVLTSKGAFLRSACDLEFVSSLSLSGHAAFADFFLNLCRKSESISIRNLPASKKPKIWNQSHELPGSQ